MTMDAPTDGRFSGESAQVNPGKFLEYVVPDKANAATAPIEQKNNLSLSASKGTEHDTAGLSSQSKVGDLQIRRLLGEGLRRQ